MRRAAHGGIALSGQLDPEELREVVQAYQAACAEVIQRYDGHIAQYLGVGLLVYFGYPRAHEDDARRAIHTGLGLVEAIGTLNTHLIQNKGIQLAMRIGIHTGLVVVGEMGGRGREEHLALGETPNVAARIQGIAAPDTVVVSIASLRLAQGLFSAEDLVSHILKGVATPLQVYRVRGEGGAPSRCEPSRHWTKRRCSRAKRAWWKLSCSINAASPPQATYLFKHALIQEAAYQSLELRAAMSLSRLWRQQGKREEARQLLAETDDWFTEGFDTADLQEAKGLLQELA